MNQTVNSIFYKLKYFQNMNQIFWQAKKDQRLRRWIFTKNKNSFNNKYILVASLLVHAAKIDENYSDSEKKIIKRALIALNKITSNEAEKLLASAEKKEQEWAEGTGKRRILQNYNFDWDFNRQEGISELSFTPSNCSTFLFVFCRITRRKK